VRLLSRPPEPPLCLKQYKDERHWRVISTISALSEKFGKPKLGRHRAPHPSKKPTLGGNITRLIKRLSCYGHFLLVGAHAFFILGWLNPPLAFTWRTGAKNHFGINIFGFMQLPISISWTSSSS